MVSPTVNTCYKVIVTDSNGCTATSNVCMKVKPLPDVTLIIQSSDTVCNNAGAILLFGNPNGGTYSGKGINGKFFYPDSVPANKYDLFYYTYTGTNGCTVIAKDSVYVEVCEGINSITGNKGIITIYPNPSNGQFVIQSSLASGQLSVEIYDILGQLILQKQLKSKSTPINLNTQANGIYLYKVIKTDGSTLGVGKLIIQK